MLETRSPFKLARRLLADEAQNFGNETLGDENGHCVTAWEHLRRRPELSVLFDIVETLPIIKSKMQDPSKVFTLFVPTNDAIESLKNWEGWLEMKNHLVEAFGSKRAMRAYLLAYHAVANETLTFSELKSLKGDDVYLEDLLNNIFPLRVNNTSSDGAVYIDGLGSTAKIIEPDIYACRAILHAVDTVFLPFDGDDQLDEEQVAMMRDATRAIAKRYNLDVPEPVDANADGRIDPYESVGAVPIESVPSDWTQGANETARR